MSDGFVRDAQTRALMEQMRRAQKKEPEKMKLPKPAETDEAKDEKHRPFLSKIVAIFVGKAKKEKK